MDDEFLHSINRNVKTHRTFFRRARDSCKPHYRVSWSMLTNQALQLKINPAKASTVPDNADEMEDEDDNRLFRTSDPDHQSIPSSKSNTSEWELFEIMRYATVRRNLATNVCCHNALQSEDSGESRRFFPRKRSEFRSEVQVDP
jgi:hypothetical protein